nr:rhodanese-like domain-containing protein [Saprospiraceae bacterium]
MRSRTLFKIFIAFFAVLLGCKQASLGQQYCENPEFEQRVKRYLSFSVPVLSVEKLREHKEDYVILDAREEEEFRVSSIPGSTFVGYRDFDLAGIKERFDLDQPIVVYCSIGYRSEKIGELLQEAGYRKVYNLYGSIFEWANRDFPLVNPENKSTKEIHTYNKRWSKWMDNEALQKVW